MSAAMEELTLEDIADFRRALGCAIPAPWEVWESHPDLGWLRIADANGRTVALVPGPPGSHDQPDERRDAIIRLLLGFRYHADALLDAAVKGMGQ